jgi:UDP-glucose 4-epimerase
MNPGPVVLLGGAGFLGTALARHLAGAGREVRIVSRRPQAASFPRTYFRGSLDDRALARRALRDASWIVHLASESVPGTAFGAAGEAEASVLPTLRLLGWLPEITDARMLFVSTGGAIYGSVATADARESAPLAPLSYYAAGKASLEAFLSAYSHQNGRSTIVLRPSNVYGPGQPVRAGFGVVPTLLEAAAARRSFTVFGTGATIRDYLYVDDFVELCARLLESPARPGVTTLNAGSGRGCSVNRLMGLVETVTGRNIRRVLRPARPGDVHRIVLNPARAHALTGWRASVSLREGVMRTWRWYCDNRH